MIHRMLTRVTALLSILVMALMPKTPPQARHIKFSLHPFVRRGHAKLLAGGRGGVSPLRLAVAVCVLALLVGSVGFATSNLAAPGVLIAAAPLVFVPSQEQRAAALAEAGRFADPGSDLLADIEGLSAEDIQYVVDNVNPFEQLSPGGLLGDALFPERRTQELSFKYLKGAGGGAVMAHVGTHNSEAPLVGRKGVSTVQGEIPAIKQKRYQDALALIRLQSADPLIRSQTVQEIYDDVGLARQGIAARLEKLRMDALSIGTASQLTEEGLVYTVDYQVPAGHKATLTGTDLWSDTVNSDPLGDFESWQNTLVADTGRAAASAITSTAVINALRAHPSIRKAIFGVNYDKRITLEELNAFMQSQDLPTLIAYDLQVAQQAANGTRSNVRLWPSNRITLIPAVATGALGRTHRAPTAEEAVKDLAEGVIVVDGFRFATHVYVSTNDPKGVVTLGVASTFPSFERADEVFQAQVLA